MSRQVMSLKAMGTYDQKTIKVVVLSENNHAKYTTGLVSIANRVQAIKFLSTKYILLEFEPHEVLTHPRKGLVKMKVMETVVVSDDDESEPGSDSSENEVGRHPSLSLHPVGHSKRMPHSVKVKQEPIEEEGDPYLEEMDPDNVGEALLLEANKEDLKAEMKALMGRLVVLERAQEAHEDLQKVREDAAKAADTKTKKGAKLHSTAEAEEEFYKQSSEAYEANKGPQVVLNAAIDGVMDQLGHIIRQQDILQTPLKPPKVKVEHREEEREEDIKSRSSRASRASRASHRPGARSKQTISQMRAIEGSIMSMQKHIMDTTVIDHFKKTEAGFREAWMADELLATITARTQRKFSRDGVNPESDKDRGLRMWFWELVIVSLINHQHLYVELVVGDLRTLWINITTFNQPDARHTYISLVKDLLDHHKSTKWAYQPWFFKLEQIFVDMVVCRREQSSADKKMYLLDLMAHDGRYTKEVHQCQDDEEITYEETARRFKHRATRMKDLTAKSEQSDTEANSATTDPPNADNSVPSEQGRGGKGKGSGRGRSKGKGKGKGNSVEGSESEEKTGGYVRQAVCEAYLYNKCSYGSRCKFKHLDLPDNPWHQRGGKEQGDATKPEQGDATKPPPACWDWDEHGTCDRTNCPFLHEGEEGTDDK
jgi:hypothetical protein